MLLLEDQSQNLTVHSVAFTPDGNYLASGTRAAILLWDWQRGINRIVERRNRIRPRSGFVPFSLSLSPDGQYLTWCDQPYLQRGSLKWHIIVCQLSEGTRTHYIIDDEPSGDRLKVGYSPDGRVVAAAGRRLHLWNTKKGELLWWWGNGTMPAGLGFATVTGCLAFAPDGQSLAAGHTYPTARPGRLRHEVVLYDPDSRNILGILPATRRVRNLIFSPNGRLLAAACENTIIVWEPPAEKALFTCQSGRRHFLGLAFTPDGRYLAATHNDKTVRMWDTRSWSERAAFDWGIGEVTCIAFAPDGMVAAAGGRSGRIVIWDVDL